MKILPDFTRLHTGENASRSLEIEISEKYRDKSVKLGFVSPLGRVLISDKLKLTAGKTSYTLPAGLLDGKGQLLCQLLIYSGEEYMCKSPVLELPVYASVDDMTSPAVSEEGLKSLAFMWEALEGKAEKSHTHGEFYTKEQTDAVAAGKADKAHTHGEFYTREQTDTIAAGKAQKEHTHSEYYTADTVDELLYEKAEKNHNHDGYYTIAQTDLMLEKKAGVKHSHDEYCTADTVDNLLEGKAEKNHNHDGYYTIAQTDLMLEKKAGVSHLHSGVYLTREEIEAMMGGEGAAHDHNHDSLYYRKPVLDSTNERLSSAEELLSSVNSTGLVYRRTLTSADDLDNITESGIYVYSTSSRPANAPFENAAVVEVFGSTSSKSQKIQRAYRYGMAGYAAFRPYYDGKWSSWKQLATTDDVELSEYNTLVMLQGHNHDSSYAKKSDVTALTDEVADNSFFIAALGDYVVEEGSTGSWRYRRWSSGVVELSGVHYAYITGVAAVSGVSGVTAVEGYSNRPDFVLSKSESEAVVQMTPCRNYLFGGSAWHDGTTVKYKVFGLTSGVNSAGLSTSGSLKVSYYVIGRWK